MRSKLAFRNMISSLILQVITAISGLILPHFFIITYGSAVNGMVSSITQFLSYLALVESGISAAAIVKLYKPLAEKDINERNLVLSASRKFYLQSGYIYSVLLLLLMFVYPLIVSNQVESITTRIMIVILAGSNLIDYYLLGKYRVLLTADQKVYVINNIQSLGTILNTVISIILIYANQNVLLVKAVGTIVYVLRAVFIILYVKKNYKKLDFKLKTHKNVLPQRWNALFHQIVGVICNNTDLVLITICLGNDSLLEVSVYYAYSLVSNTFTTLFNSFSNGMLSGFGELFAIHDTEKIKKAYSSFEYIYFILLFVVYICMLALLIPFIRLYTKGVTDTNYIRPVLACLFVLMGSIQNIRIPSMTMICAAGHYKETQFRAFLEALINLSVSLVLIFKLGISGAIIGTICSYTYRTTDCILYTSKYLVRGTAKKTVIRLARNGLASIGIVFVLQKVILSNSITWIGFIFNGVLSACFSGVMLFIVNVFFEPKEMKQFLDRIMRIIS